MKRRQPDFEEWFDEPLPSRWSLVGVVTALAASILGWVAVAYAALWASRNADVLAKGGALALLLAGSWLLYYALAQMDREDDARPRRRP